MRQIRNYLLTGLILLTALSSAAVAQQPEMYRPNDTNRQLRQISFRLPFYSKAQVIDVEIVNGKIIFQGDIILGDEALLTAPQVQSAGNYDKRWTDGVIPYVLNKTHPDYTDIVNAIRLINKESNLSLVRRTNETDYVEFVSGDGCSSAVGRKGGRQTIEITSCGVGATMHEIMHAAGFYHEQSRSDRDHFVTINWDNIEEGKEHNFKTYAAQKLSGEDIGDYDYASIMHYGTYFFSKNGKPTIEPKDSTATIGRQDKLSSGDLKGISSLYPVKARPFDSLEVGGSSVKPNVDCRVWGCPVGNTCVKQEDGYACILRTTPTPRFPSWMIKP